MLKKILLVAIAAVGAAKAYGWLRREHQQSRKKESKEALQVWENEGGNPPTSPPASPLVTGKTAKPAA